MEIKVNQESCIGCGACCAICESVFDLNDDGVSYAKVEKVNDDKAQEVKDAAEACPTGAIEVTE